VRDLVLGAMLFLLRIHKLPRLRILGFAHPLRNSNNNLSRNRQLAGNEGVTRGGGCGSKLLRESGMWAVCDADLLYEHDRHTELIAQADALHATNKDTMFDLQMRWTQGDAQLLKDELMNHAKRKLIAATLHKVLVPIMQDGYNPRVIEFLTSAVLRKAYAPAFFDEDTVMRFITPLQGGNALKKIIDDVSAYMHKFSAPFDSELSEAGFKALCEAM
jgi:hypothetical protein